MKLFTPHRVTERHSMGHVKVGVHSMKMPKVGKAIKFTVKAPKMSKAKIKI